MFISALVTIQACQQGCQQSGQLGTPHIPVNQPPRPEMRQLVTAQLKQLPRRTLQGLHTLMRYLPARPQPSQQKQELKTKLQQLCRQLARHCQFLPFNSQLRQMFP